MITVKWDESYHQMTGSLSRHTGYKTTHSNKEMVAVYRRSFSCDSTTITSLDNYIRVVTLHTCILEEMTVISKTWYHSRRLECCSPFWVFCVVIFGWLSVAHLFIFLCCYYCFVCLHLVSCVPNAVSFSTGNYTNIVIMYICLNKYRCTNKC
jgi:hypothetical protein